MSTLRCEIYAARWFGFDSWLHSAVLHYNLELNMINKSAGIIKIDYLFEVSGEEYAVKGFRKALAKIANIDGGRS